MTCKPSSLRVRTSLVRTQLLPAFGAQELRSLSRSQVKAFVADKQQRYTAKHVGNILRALHTILAHAVDEELLDRNPAMQVGKFLPEKTIHPGRTIDPFTSAELARYLATMQTSAPRYYPYFLCLARTGMREGEALALHWDDIQWGRDAADPHRFLAVQRTYDPVHHLFNTPKSGHSRQVDMSRELREAFLIVRQQREDTAARQGKATLSPVVFCTASGRPWTPRQLYAVHREVCTRTGLRVNRIHDLRHSYATIQLYEHHAPIQYVSEQLGHASIRITVDIYGHPRQGTSIALADRLDQPAASRHLDATSAQPDPFREDRYPLFAIG